VGDGNVEDSIMRRDCEWVKRDHGAKLNRNTDDGGPMFVTPSGNERRKLNSFLDKHDFEQIV
jgi:hypothetical protein